MTPPSSQDRVSVCYLLRSRRSNGVPTDLLWEEQEAPKAQCKRCHRVHPEHYPRPLDQVVARRPTGIGSDHRWGGGLWRRDLLEALKPWLKDCVIGRLYLRNTRGTTELTNWATCYIKPGLEIFESRGKLARYVACPICEHPYSVNGATAQRIVRRCIPPDRIAITDWGNIYLHPAIESAIDWTPFKDAYRGSIKLIDEPEDGQCLPGDPDWAPGKTRFADPPGPGQPKWIDDPDQTDEPIEYD